MRSRHSYQFIAVSVLFVFAAALPSLSAQSPGEQPAISSQLRAQMERVLKAAMASDYAYQQLRHLSNNIGPRLAGSPQAQFAAEYVGGEMRKLGLEVTLEKVKVPHWVRGAESAALIEYPGQAPGTAQKIMLTALGGSVGTPADGLTADVVVVRNFAELEALGRAGVAGKIVLYNVVFDKRLTAQNEPGPAYGAVVAYRGRGAVAAEALGAVASLVRSAGGADYRLPHTGTMSDSEGKPRPITKGALDGNKISLTVASEWQGNPITLVVTGTVSGDTMNLKIQTEDGAWGTDALVKRSS